MIGAFFLLFIVVFIAYIESLQKKALVKALADHQYTLIKMKTTRTWFQFPGGPVTKPSAWSLKNPYAIKEVTFSGRNGEVIACLVAIVNDKNFKPANVYFSIDLNTLQPVQQTL